MIFEPLQRCGDVDIVVGQQRLPYVEPLNLLRIELLKRLRSGDTDGRIGEVIQLSINAIATALRNSG